MSTDRNIEDTLKNLEIISPEVSKSSQYQSNPFAIVPSSLNNPKVQDEMLSKLFGKRCKCGEISSKESSNSTSAKPRIIQPTHFKAKNTSKRHIIKESKLKNIGKCIHNNIIRKDTSGLNNNGSNSFKKSLDNNKERASKSFGGDSNDQVLDFRLLVNRYNELSLSSPSSSSSNTSEDEINFTRTCFTTLRPKSAPSKSSTLEPSRSSESLNMNHITQPSSSCSQQARISPPSFVPGDDITADEIASYFETLVYIPKKMSKMAEMMYI